MVAGSAVVADAGLASFSWAHVLEMPEKQGVEKNEKAEATALFKDAVFAPPHKLTGPLLGRWPQGGGDRRCLAEEPPGQEHRRPAHHDSLRRLRDK